MADNKVNSGLLEFSEDQKVFVALDAETSEVKKAVTIDGDGVETDIGGGGGGDVTVEALSVTENGTYSEEGKAYSPVTVNVPSGLTVILPEQTVTLVDQPVEIAGLRMDLIPVGVSSVPLKGIEKIQELITNYTQLNYINDQLVSTDGLVTIYPQDGKYYFVVGEAGVVSAGEYTISIAIF